MFESETIFVLLEERKRKGYFEKEFNQEKSFLRRKRKTNFVVLVCSKFFCVFRESSNFFGKEKKKTNSSQRKKKNKTFLKNFSKLNTLSLSLSSLLTWRKKGVGLSFQSLFHLMIQREKQKMICWVGIERRPAQVEEEVFD